ncbi:acyl-CoA-binding domain-containing protein 6-like [Solanum stenotomum]|uniref:acyl-CoA-binding domain-containing protein 6-like n=1 Tax=Solanum stenotomum TaxID=172797 RepID=UPI0020D1C34F|nr:acyl-CoA-binding domain-containing protein 6-like [Solanum stenotomum]
MGSDGQNWYLGLTYDQWVPLSVSGPTPAARYKHAAVTVDGKLYIIGGSRNGRYLSDIQVFDLKSLTWSTIKLNSGVLPATSGHNMTLWENKLLFLAGHSKDVSDTVTVRFIDLQSYECGVIETFGKLPVARGGQSVTLFGSKLIMFGGEDQHRRLLNDISVLDLETMTWSTVETTQTSPAPRFDHTAALHANRYLLILGGCSHSIFFNDLHVLDLETMEWSQPQLQGDLVSPRAGHAGVTIGDNWYIVGGGDNKSGVPETLMLNIKGGDVHKVTAKGKTCSCRKWRNYHISCSHASKFCGHSEIKPKSYTSGVQVRSRLKNDMDIAPARMTRKCSLCKEMGHTKAQFPTRF